MSVLLRTSLNLPEAKHFDRWLAVGPVSASPDPDTCLPELPARLEDAFDAIADTWLELGRELGRTPSAGLAHAPACVANASDLGLMMAWAGIVGEEATRTGTALVICDDPWAFRHLMTINGVQAGRPPGKWWPSLKLSLRGFAARIKCAAGLAKDVHRLRKQRQRASVGGAVLLVYGHPHSTANGTDGYFGPLLKELPNLHRILHVDCSVPRALELEKDGRTLSLRAWGQIRDTLTLPFARWTPEPAQLEGKWSWLIRRAAAQEGGTGQGAMIAWQLKCQRRWLNEVQPRAVAWPWENHSWERGFVRDARNRALQTLGYQHSVIGRQMLNYRPASNPDGLQSLPDRILCTGQSTLRQLSGWGVPEQRLLIGGALRIPNIPPMHPTPDGPIFVALPFDAEIAGQMVQAARTLTKKGFHFLIKEHPMVPFDFTDSVGLKRTTQPFNEHPGLRAVVYAATTVGLEAALAGLPTIRFRPQGCLAVDILPPDIHLPAADASSLEAALRNTPPPTLARDEIFSLVPKDLWKRMLADD